MANKTVYIVVEDGLVQSVHASFGLNVDVVLCDLDTEDPDERADAENFVAQLPDFAKQVY